jgi:hypothetical protein
MLLLAIALTVGFTTMVPGASSWGDVPVVDPTVVTNTLSLSTGGMTAAFGIDANGGAYWNSLNISGFSQAPFEGRELAQAGCGRGGQLAEVDRAHNTGDYNPTQAGSGFSTCTPVTVTAATRKLCASQFDMPLFQAAGQTFTNFHSEQSLALCYIDRSALFSVPAVQVDTLVGYLEPPAAIHQFDNTYDPGFAVTDIDQGAEGHQQAKANDLSREQITWGLRLNLSDFPDLMWQNAGIWQSQALTTSNFDCQTGTNNAVYVYANGQIVRQNTVSLCGGVDNDMMCLTTSTNSATALAVCLYAPLSGFDATNNVTQTYLVSGNNATGYNWHVQSRFRSFTASPVVSLSFIHSLSGTMIANANWQATSGRYFMLVCPSPAQCATAVTSWKAGSHTGDETP